MAEGFGNNAPMKQAGRGKQFGPMRLCTSLIVFIALLSFSLPAAAPASKPNILVIVSDDQGYADAGFQGGHEIPTPNLDRLARGGLRCTSGYVTHPFCSPTRAALMTGRYQQRFGHENNPAYAPDDPREGLPASERLLPACLADAGYVTGWIGKWHLGGAPALCPPKRGFKETFGFLGGGHRYQNWTPDPAKDYQIPILRNGQPVEVTNHLTAVFGHEAAAFIRRHQSEPWFLYLAFNAPHTPHEPTPERLAQFESITNKTRQVYAAQVSLLDDAVGITLSALRETSQDRQTLVFFFSDNGGYTNSGSRNTPLREVKGTVYEGGIRVPFLVSWPGQLPAGREYPQPVSSLDVFATALAVAGVPMPTDKKYDGVNLLPFLKGEKSGAPHDRLFWRTSSGLRAVREGNLKLVRPIDKRDELYDLSTDISETNNLARAKPEDLKRLGQALDAWNKELVPPAFAGMAARKPAAKTSPATTREIKSKK